MEQVQGIVDGAREVHAPVILQVSRGALNYAGRNYIRHLIIAASESAPDGGLDEGSHALGDLLEQSAQKLFQFVLVGDLEQLRGELDLLGLAQRAGDLPAEHRPENAAEELLVRFRCLAELTALEFTALEFATFEFAAFELAAFAELAELGCHWTLVSVHVLPPVCGGAGREGPGSQPP